MTLTIATAAFLITTSPAPGLGFGALSTVKGCAAGAVIQAASFSVILRTSVTSEYENRLGEKS
jgi:hypothetical protein